MARVLMVLADGFLSAELKLKALLERKGHTVRVSARQRITMQSADGETIMPDMALYEINSDYFDFMVIAGEKIKDIITPELVTAIRKCAAKRGVVGISNGPVALAFAGVLNGKRATVHNEKLIKFLKDSGAEYKADGLVVDGNIITAAYPEMIDEIFAAIMKLIEK